MGKPQKCQEINEEGKKERVSPWHTYTFPGGGQVWETEQADPDRRRTSMEKGGLCQSFTCPFDRLSEQRETGHPPNGHPSLGF